MEQTPGAEAPGSSADVRRNPRKARLGTRLRQVFQAEVELVIAHHHRVVSEGVHRQHHRVAARGQGDAIRVLINRFERRALDGIAAIDQQCVRVFRPRGMDERRDFGEAPARRAAR